MNIEKQPNTAGLDSLKYDSDDRLQRISCNPSDRETIIKPNQKSFQPNHLRAIRWHHLSPSEGLIQILRSSPLRNDQAFVLSSIQKHVFPDEQTPKACFEVLVTEYIPL